MRVPVMIGAVLALAVFGGCGGGGGTPTTAPSPSAGSAAIQCNTAGSGSAVEIKGNAYNPGSITVAVNGQADWTNNDGVSHTVSFDGGPDCGTLAGGAAQSVLFTVAGTYPYRCNIHPSMKGTVTVQ